MPKEIPVVRILRVGWSPSRTSATGRMHGRDESTHILHAPAASGAGRGVGWSEKKKLGRVATWVGRTESVNRAEHRARARRLIADYCRSNLRTATLKLPAHCAVFRCSIFTTQEGSEADICSVVHTHTPARAPINVPPSALDVGRSNRSVRLDAASFIEQSSPANAILMIYAS